MRAYAREGGEDEELWAITGLVHDLDYERYPDLDTGHPRHALKELEARGYPKEVIDAVAGHAEFLGVPRETPLAKTLFAVDELSGFIAACALVRPTGIEGMTPKSVRKKLKAPSFAARRRSRSGSPRGRGARRRLRPARQLRDRGDGRAGRRARPRAAPSIACVRRGWKILIGALVALAILLAVNTIVLDQETKAAEVTVSGGRILDLPGGAVQVVEQGPTAGKPPRREARRRAADRAPALLRLLAPLVGPDGPPAGEAPSRDPHRPARLRRLREAEERLLDGGPGAPRRPGPGQAPRPGRGRRRPLDGVRRGDRARRASPASWSTAWSTSTPPRTPASATCRSWPGSPSPR